MKIKKGQFSYDYFISLIVFILAVIYIIFQIIAMKPAYLNEIRNEILRSETYQVSEMLVNDAGQPQNWDTENVKRLGLSSDVNKTNYLSAIKIARLGSLCPQAGYDSSFMRLLGVDQKYQLSIIVKNTTPCSSAVLVDCHPSSQIAARTVNTSVKRIVGIDAGCYGEVTVQMW